MSPSVKRVLFLVFITNMPIASRRELSSFLDAYRHLSNDQIHQQIDKSINRKSQLSLKGLNQRHLVYLNMLVLFLPIDLIASFRPRHLFRI